VRVLTDTAASPTDYFLYKAFGEEVSVVGTSESDYRYGGLNRYFRSDMGLLGNIGQRCLRSDLASWLSRAPWLPVAFLVVDGGLYKDVSNNPIMFSDPSGLAASCPAKKCCCSRLLLRRLLPAS